MFDVGVFLQIDRFSGFVMMWYKQKAVHVMSAQLMYGVLCFCCILFFRSEFFHPFSSGHTGYAEHNERQAEDLSHVDGH